MNADALRRTELIRLMLISLNVKDQVIQPKSRFREDMRLSEFQFRRLINMIEDCYEIYLDQVRIASLSDLTQQVYESIAFQEKMK